MIRRFFQWRAKRRFSRTRYRFDRRNYPGQFRAGFLSHLQQASFWEMKKNPRFRRRRLRRKIVLVLLILGLLLLIWGIHSSIAGLKLFALLAPNLS